MTQRLCSAHREHYYSIDDRVLVSCDAEDLLSLAQQF